MQKTYQLSVPYCVRHYPPCRQEHSPLYAELTLAVRVQRAPLHPGLEETTVRSRGGQPEWEETGQSGTTTPTQRVHTTQGGPQRRQEDRTDLE